MGSCWQISSGGRESWDLLNEDKRREIFSGGWAQYTLQAALEFRKFESPAADIYSIYFRCDSGQTRREDLLENTLCRDRRGNI